MAENQEGVKNAFDALVRIQHEIKAPKNQFNSFGKYNYRSKEDILEGAKELNHRYGCFVTVTDEIKELNGRYYVTSTATLYHAESNTSVHATGQAREDDARKGMDGAQITGTSSSYAGKRALANLYALDDTKDSDAYENSPKTGGSAPRKPVAQQTRQNTRQTTNSANSGVIGVCVQCAKKYKFKSVADMNAYQCDCGCTRFEKVN